MKRKFLGGTAFAIWSGVGLAQVPEPQPAPTADEVAGEDEIVVTGQRASQERALQLKRDAIGIVDVASADEIGRLPDRNVAEVVERLPGVGVLYDQGEGRFVSVRGIPAELNNYTVNGFELGNPDGNTRALPLDIVSGQLLNRVEVVKAKTANLDGQGIGASINLVTQTAFDFRDAFVVQANAQVGYQELGDNKAPVRGDVSVGGRFGADQQFGILVGASYSDRTFTSFGFFPDDWRPLASAARGGVPINIKVTDYRLSRERIGGVASLDWRPSDDHQFYVRGLYSKFTEDEYRQRYRLDFATDALIANGSFRLNADGVTGVTTAGTERRQDLRLEEKEKSVLTVQAGGSSRFDPWRVDYGVARVRNEVREPNMFFAFRGNPGAVDFDFTDRLFTAVPRAELTPAGLQFRQFTMQDEDGEEDIWQGRIDVRRDLAMGNDSFVGFGAKYRATDKSFDANNTVYNRGGTAATRFTLAQFGLAGSDMTIFPRRRRGYAINPTIDERAIVAFVDDRLAAASPLFVLATATTLANATLGDFDIDEDVIAGYVQANLQFGDVTVTPGLRVERTKLDVTGFALENRTTVVPARGGNSYTDVLPSLILRYEPSRGVVLRGAYTRSVGRPQYDSLSPGASVTFEDNGDGSSDGEVDVGNPNLKPFRSDAIDLAAEYYFARGSLLSFSAFGKFIRDPIFTQALSQEDVEFNGRRFANLDVSQPLNADSAELFGVELAYQQQFRGLPGLLSGLGVEANISYIDSSLLVPGRREEVSFPQQSRFIYGAQIFYQRGPVEASVAYHHTGRNLLAVRGEPFQDEYSDDFRRLDAKVTVAATDNVAVFAEAQNLTDEPTRQYQSEEHRDWVIQNERYGRTFYGGVSLRF